MKIRDKLLLGFGFYILFAVVCGFIAYKNLSKITSRLKLVEVADDITNTILEVRRYEKNYLLFRDKASLEEFEKYLSAFKKNIDKIEAEIIREIGTENYAMMKKTLDEYEKLFKKINANFIAQDELSTVVKTAGINIEGELNGKDLQTFLVLRRYEKNLMLDKDETSRDLFLRTSTLLNSDIHVERYVMLVKRLCDLYAEEKNSMDVMRLRARELQSFTENLSKRERADIGRILQRSGQVLLIALLGVTVLGMVINIKLATSIADPLRRLEKITKKVAKGDFSEAIKVTGKDEIASLELSFNQMEERLQDAMTSLELTIEKLQEKQAELVKSEKLASIGKLAAGIAHEINNPLTSVLTFSSLLLEQCPESDPRHERLKMVVKETTRARNIVRQVLNFAKEAPLRKEKINVNRLVKEIADSLNAQGTFKDIELSMSIFENLPDIYIDAVQIGQVITNVLVNAVHAITPPGKITIVTQTAGNFVEIIFTDTGSGIPEENLKKVFDPFFTTKDKTKGTGLGLAVSYGIIKKHGGDIEVRSTLDQGSTFIVRLPLYG
ncbi:MAG: ATP-binding protein [Thermodesulfovibrionales bacterium]